MNIIHVPRSNNPNKKTTKTYITIILKRSKTKILCFGLQWCHLQQYLISRHIIYKQQYKVYTHSTAQIMIITSRNLYIHGVVYFHNYEKLHSVSIKNIMVIAKIRYMFYTLCGVGCYVLYTYIYLRSCGFSTKLICQI